MTSERFVVRVRPISKTMTELETADAIVLFSYETPVALKTKRGKQSRYYKTGGKLTQTSKGHITKWLRRCGYEGVTPATMSPMMIDEFLTVTPRNPRRMYQDSHQAHQQRTNTRASGGFR